MLIKKLIRPFLVIAALGALCACATSPETTTTKTSSQTTVSSPVTTTTSETTKTP